YELAVKEYYKIVKFRHKAVDVNKVTVEINEMELPIRAAAWYQLGNSYKKLGDYEKAISSFRKVTDEPEVPEEFRATVQYQIGDTRFYQQQYEQAAEEYARFVEMFPNSALVDKAYFYQGFSLFKAKEYGKAIEVFSDMLARYPDSKYAPDAQFRIASCYYEQEQYEKAIEEAQKLLEKYPKSVAISDASYLMATSYEALGQYEKAIEVYQRVIDLYDTMYELLRASFREGKNVDFENYLRLFNSSFLKIADIYRERMGDFQKAYETYVRAQETVEEYDSKAKIQKLIGDNYQKWGKYDKAIEAYRRVITNYPQSPYLPQAQFYIGEAYYYWAKHEENVGNYEEAKGKYEEAIKAYQAVLENYPDADTKLLAQALYSAGWSAEQLGDKERAVEFYAQVVERYPRSPSAPVCMLRLGRIAYDGGKYAEAEQYYRQMIERYSEAPEVGDAYYYLGLVLRRRGEKDRALEMFSRVPETAGQSYVGAQLAMASLHAEMEKPQKAEAILEELEGKVSGDPQLEVLMHFQMGQLYLGQLEDYRKAVQHYTAVIERFPQSEYIVYSYFGRGQAYHKLLEFDKAIEDYQYLLKAPGVDPQMLDKTKLALALVYSAVDRGREAEELLRDVTQSRDRTLAQAARVQLVALAEKESPEDAIRIYNELLSQAQDNMERSMVLARLATVYFKLGRYQESIDTALRLTKVSKKEESIASGYYTAGNAYMKMGRYLDAVAQYKKVVEEYPTTLAAPGALFQMGAAYYYYSEELKGKPQEKQAAVLMSTKAFLDYYHKYPESKEALQALYLGAWGYYRLGKWEEASKTFLTLVRRYPKSRQAAEALFRAGESLFNLKRWDEAYALFERVEREYPKSEWVDDSIYSRAWCFVRKGEKEKAVPLFERLVAEFKEGDYGPMAQFTLGDYYYGEERYDEAKAAYEKFIELFPDHPRVRRAKMLLANLAEISAYKLYSQGEVLFDQEKYKEAIEIFEEVLQKYPGSVYSASALVNIGASYQAMEEFEKAAEYYRRVVEEYGSDPNALAQVKFAETQLKTLIEARVISMGK
ncbi:MAG: hypothetical protein DRP95_01745, partial [Candidatus Latescibacterota bacterium]